MGNGIGAAMAPLRGAQRPQGPAWDQPPQRRTGLSTELVHGGDLTPGSFRWTGEARTHLMQGEGVVLER